jgi:diguanylate cyclase (GGDEF)-like protein
MINVTAQELETILATIDKALAMHDAWREQLVRTLICRLTPREDDMADDAHQKCQFGQWFYSSSNSHLRKLASFQRLGDLHQTMHNHARDLTVMVKARWMIGPKEYDPYIAQMTRFRGELLNLRQKIFDTLHKIDPLTGAFCSMHLLPDLEKDQAKQTENGAPYSLLMLQLDLMQINRMLGRDKGDEILRQTIAGLRSSVGSAGKIYRYAGAEFVICLPGLGHDQAHALKEDVMAVVNQTLAAVAGDSGASLDIHYGVTELEPGVYVEQLIRAAKRATFTVTV